MNRRPAVPVIVMKRLFHTLMPLNQKALNWNDFPGTLLFQLNSFDQKGTLFYLSHMTHV